MAAPSIQGSVATTAVSAATSINVNIPSGATSGELLLILIANADPALSAETFNTVTGWTKADEHYSNAYNGSIAAYWKQSDGTEGGGTVTITVDDSAEMAAYCFRISGANTTTPFDVIGTADGRSSYRSTPPSVTTTEDDCLVFAFAFADANYFANSFQFEPTTAGWTKGSDLAAGNYCSVGYGYKTQATAGATGACTIAIDNTYVSEQTIGKLYAIAPQGEAPAATETATTDARLKKSGNTESHGTAAAIVVARSHTTQCGIGDVIDGEDQTLYLRPDGHDDIGSAQNQSGGTTNLHTYIDEETQDGDTTYIKYGVFGTSSTTDATFTLSDHGVSTTTDYAIKSVAVTAFCKHDGDNVSSHYKAILKTGGQTYKSGSQSTGSSYSSITATYTTNPRTGGPWQWDQLNDLIAGVELGPDADTFNCEVRCTQVYVTVTYHTRNIGTVGTASHDTASILKFNALNRDHRGIRYVQLPYSHTTGEYTTSSATYEDTTISGTFSVDTQRNYLFFTAGTTAFDTNDVEGSLRMVVDDTYYLPEIITSHVRKDYSQYPINYHFVSGLTTGQHTLKLQAKVESGTFVVSGVDLLAVSLGNNDVDITSYSYLVDNDFESSASWVNHPNLNSNDYGFDTEGDWLHFGNFSVRTALDSSGQSVGIGITERDNWHRIVGNYDAYTVGNDTKKYVHNGVAGLHYQTHHGANMGYRMNGTYQVSGLNIVDTAIPLIDNNGYRLHAATTRRNTTDIVYSAGAEDSIFGSTEIYIPEPNTPVLLFGTALYRDDGDGNHTREIRYKVDGDVVAKKQIGCKTPWVSEYTTFSTVAYLGSGLHTITATAQTIAGDGDTWRSDYNTLSVWPLYMINLGPIYSIRADQYNNKNTAINRGLSTTRPEFMETVSFNNFDHDDTSGYHGTGQAGNPRVIRFDGIDDNIEVSVPYSESGYFRESTFYSTRSYAAWIKTSDPITSGYIFHGDDISETQSFDALWIDGDYKVRATHDPTIDPSETSQLISDVSLSAGTWYHIAVVLNDYGNESRLYINSGLQDDSWPNATNVSSWVTTANNYIGGDPQGNKNLSMDLGSFDMWNYALSAENVRELYENEADFYYASGVIEYTTDTNTNARLVKEETATTTTDARLKKEETTDHGTAALLASEATDSHTTGAKLFKPPKYPLSVSSDNRRILDADGTPQYFVGDAAWSMGHNIPVSGIDVYLEDRQARGVNALLVQMMLTEIYYLGSVNNFYGDAPFSDLNDWSTINTDYFAPMYSGLKNAHARGMTVFMCPAYVGYPSTNEGWASHTNQYMQNNADADMFTFGEFLANFFPEDEFPNIVWLLGGDGDEDDFPGAISKNYMLQSGIVSVDTNRLWSAHGQHPNSALDSYLDYNLDFNTTYAIMDVEAEELLEDWNFTPTHPTLHIEGKYEESPSNTPTDIEVRSQMWWALLGGAIGHIYGHSRVWDYVSYWTDKLEDTGSNALGVHADYARGDLSPDYGHHILQNGYGSISDTTYAGCAISEDKSQLLVYTPSQRALHVVYSGMVGTKADCNWINPATGDITAIGTVDTTISGQIFTPPSSGDWVLKIDSTGLAQHTTNALFFADFRTHDTDALLRAYTDLYEVDFNSLTDPESSDDHVLSVRARKGNAIDSGTLIASLVQGVTEIASTSIVLTDSFVTTEYTLSAAEADSITDYGNLSVRLQAYTEDSDGLRVEVSWVEFRTPEGAVGAYTTNHDTDAVLASEGTSSHDTDAVLAAGRTASHDTDAKLIVSTVTDTTSHATDALLASEDTSDHTTQAVLASEDTSDHTTQAVLASEDTSDHTTQAVLAEENTDSHDTDSRLKKENTFDTTTNAVLFSDDAFICTTDARLKKTDSTTTDTNSVIALESTSSIDTDAVLAEENTNSHNTDAVLALESTVDTDTDSRLKGTEEVSVNTDAKIFSATGADMSTSARLRRTETTNVNTDSVIYEESQAQVSTDAGLKKEETQQHITDSRLKKTEEFSSTTNALLELSSEVSGSTNAVLLDTVETTTTTDALIAEEYTYDTDTDALLYTENTSQSDTDARLKKEETQEHSTDALVFGGNSKLVNTNARLRKEETSSTDTNALVYLESTVSSDTDAVLYEEQTYTHAVDALLYLQSTETIDTDAVLAEESTTDVDTDSRLWSQRTETTTTDAKMILDNAEFHFTDARLLDTTEYSHTTDSKIVTRTTVDFDTDAVIALESTEDTNTDALLLLESTITNTSNAVLYTENTEATSTDARLKRTEEHTTSTDAMLSVGVSINHGTQTVLLDTKNTSSTTDAFIVEEGSKTHTTDSDLKKTTQTSHDSDAFLANAGGDSHDTDALLYEQYTVQHTTGALLIKYETHGTAARLLKEKEVSHDTQALVRNAGWEDMKPIMVV